MRLAVVPLAAAWLWFAACGVAEPLPDKKTAAHGLRSGYLRVGTHSIRRDNARRLIFSREANPRRYWYGLIWLLPALPMFWSVYRRMRDNPRRQWRKLGWKLNLGIPLYIFFCVLTTGAGTRVVIDPVPGTIKRETTWAGRTVRTLEERSLKDARGLRVLNIGPPGRAWEIVLVVEFEKAGEWMDLFPINTRDYPLAPGRELLYALEAYASETTGLRRFQR